MWASQVGRRCAEQANEDGQEDDDIRSESYAIRSRDHIKSMTVGDAEDVTQLGLIEAGCEGSSGLCNALLIDC